MMVSGVNLDESTILARSVPRSDSQDLTSDQVPNFPESDLPGMAHCDTASKSPPVDSARLPCRAEGRLVDRSANAGFRHQPILAH